MFSLQLDSHFVTLPDGLQGEIQKYIGSEIWSVKYRKNNNNYIMTYRTKQLDFNGNDVDYLKRKLSK